MNPIYKFQLSAGTDVRQAYPVYKDDLTIDYELEQGEEFYRGKLSGKLTFQKDDYDFIRSKSFDTQFSVDISISYNNGQTWTAYWSGRFWKTDCEFNEDDQTVVVTPNVNDRYNAVLAGMDKEYNLIDLAPVIESVKLDKRPMIQIYVPGQTVIGCFLSGMWWEQECNAVDSENDLLETYHFSENKRMRVLDVTQTGTPVLPSVVMGTPDGVSYYDITKSGYRFRVYLDNTTDPNNPFYIWEIVRVRDSARMWSFQQTGNFPAMPYNVTLSPNENAGATGIVNLYIRDIAVFARYVTDVESVSGVSAYPIPADDIVENNRNYHYVVGYYFPNTIWFSDYLTATPTKWGIYQPGLYYDPGIPSTVGAGEAFPIARAAWGRISLWFMFFSSDVAIESNVAIESKWRKEFVLKDAYPIWSVISVLLDKIAPEISHEGTTTFSRFLYGTNPLTDIDQYLFITPKSNVIASGYDQPARKAPITLRQITNMLRDCFRCYWFIDAQNRFRIEHIWYFMRGGTYSGTPVVGMDLTRQIVTRNGKPWSFARNQYEFDKPQMPSRYQFGWMDDVTELFEGFPIDVISNYVDLGNIEQINISQFTSDVDYILLNPGEISKDGFVLLAATTNNVVNESTLNFTAGAEHSSSNGRVLLNVKSGDVFSLKIENLTGELVQNPSVIIYAKYGEGSQSVYFWMGTIPLNTYVDFVANGDMTSVGLYFTPENIISSGTARLSAKFVDGVKLPYYNFAINYTDHYLQNAWLSFMYLQFYYMYDMPTYDVEINGEQQRVRGIKKLKRQTLKFPVLTEPDMFNLIKTGLGNGVIEKLSVNLSSRNANATLKYDTE